MIKVIESADKLNKYLDPNSQFNEETFDEDEFFDFIAETVSDILVKICGNGYSNADDFKGNIGYHEYPEWGEFDVSSHFSWIFYDSDIPKKEFSKIAKNLEKELNKKFSNAREIECTRYDNSLYAQDGYDVNLVIRLEYKYLEEDIWRTK